MIDGAPAAADCPRRIFLPTDTGFLYAINADDGTLCQRFGDYGRVDLKTGSPYQVAGSARINPTLAAVAAYLCGARLFVFRRGADAPELEYDFLSTMSRK